MIIISATVQLVAMYHKLKSLGITAAMLYSAGYAMQSMSVNLRHFTAAEFGVWWPLINPRLLTMLDEYRERLGVPVQISPALGAIGRIATGSESQHIPQPFINAVDVMPKTDDLQYAYRVAVETGFTGIGVYPDWQPRAGLHLDVRNDRVAGDPDKWSGIQTANGQEYFEVERAWA